MLAFLPAYHGDDAFEFCISRLTDFFSSSDSQFGQARRK
jgi:hypothetical protein